MDVISLDDERIKINEYFVSKKTSINEVCNLKIAKKMIKDLYVNANGISYKICVPEIFDYNSGYLKMERCKGENLELLLRNDRLHKENVNILNNLLITFLDNNFYWDDFAPRNIIINNEENKISIFDFERGIETSKNLSDYFLYPVLEEYSAFLLENERIFNDKILYNTKLSKIIDFNQIKSNRIKKIMEKLGMNIITKEDLIKVILMIINAEKPYVFDKKNYFPIVELENILKEKGYDDYATEVIKTYEKLKSI